MNGIEISRVKNNLANNLKQYVSAITEKYSRYIPQERLNYLKSIDDFGSVINIYDYGSVNAYATDYEISMPLCADRLLNMASKVIGYGINKNHKTYNADNIITNNNTFVNYIYHVFVSGTNTEGYFDDMLLHETMHFCGSGGATALKEGINELLTRKVALENGFRTNGCGYPKEVQVAYRLQNLFGEEIFDQIAFINSEEEIYKYLNDAVGKDGAELYSKVSQIMEKEFDEKYYSKMDSYNGITGIISKTVNYKKIDYTKIYKLLDYYEQLKQQSVQEEITIKH